MYFESPSTHKGSDNFNWTIVLFVCVLVTKSNQLMGSAKHRAQGFAQFEYLY